MGPTQAEPVIDDILDSVCRMAFSEASLDRENAAQWFLDWYTSKKMFAGNVKEKFIGKVDLIVRALINLDNDNSNPKIAKIPRDIIQGLANTKPEGFSGFYKYRETLTGREIDLKKIEEYLELVARQQAAKEQAEREQAAREQAARE